MKKKEKKRERLKNVKNDQGGTEMVFEEGIAISRINI